MGLRFVNRLGLAAGVDRNGAALAQHAASGAGHVEIGTVTDARQLELSPRAGSKHLVVGINFASARQGIDSDVIEDYGRLLRSLWSRADYLVANFSAPAAGRGVETSGIEFLIDQLSVTCRDAARETGLIRPLLLKIRAGVCGAPVPSGIAAARDCGIDGLVLVTSFAERIIECSAEIGGMAVISVGSIATARDAKARLEAGAVLFQIYSSYVAGGAKAVRTIVDSTLEVEPSM